MKNYEISGYACSVSGNFLYTAREQEVLQLLVNGYSYKMIAAECSISHQTVQTYIKRIYEKLQAHSATEAIAKAFPNRRV